MNKLNAIITILCLILLIITIQGMIFIAKSEAVECISNPVIYGMNKLDKDISCVCFLSSGKTLNINNTDIWQKKTFTDISNIKINIS